MHANTKYTTGRRKKPGRRIVSSHIAAAVAGFKGPTAPAALLVVLLLLGLARLPVRATATATGGSMALRALGSSSSSLRRRPCFAAASQLRRPLRRAHARGLASTMSAPSDAAPEPSPSSTPHPRFDDAYLGRIQARIRAFQGDPIPLIEGTPSTSRIKLPDSGAGVKQPRTAAVLIPLCNAQGKASLLFQVRTSKVKTHKGQVSFPGGHIEAGETPLEAALRECREEMGDAIGSIRVLGACQQLPAVTGTIVTPILGYVVRDVGDLSHLTPSPDEVDALFTLSLPQLTDPALAGHEDLGLRSSKAPFYLGGPAKVWGLTAFILQGVLLNVLKPALLDGGCEGAGEGGEHREASSSSSSSRL